MARQSRQGKEQGVAEIIEEKNLNINTIQIAINELVYNEEKYKDMKNNLSKVNSKNSSLIIYEKIKELIK